MHENHCEVVHIQNCASHHTSYINFIGNLKHYLDIFPFFAARSLFYLKLVILDYQEIIFLLERRIQSTDLY
jgi:hypothetical protein